MPALSIPPCSSRPSLAPFLDRSPSAPDDRNTAWATRHRKSKRPRSRRASSSTALVSAQYRSSR